MLAASFPYHSLRSSKDNSLSILRSRPTQVQQLFTLVLRLFGTTSHCLSAQPGQLLHSRTSEDTSPLTWPFQACPMARWCYRSVTSITSVEHWFQLLHHWAWLHQGYWGYRNLIYLLIDWRSIFEHSSTNIVLWDSSKIRFTIVRVPAGMQWRHKIESVKLPLLQFSRYQWVRKQTQDAPTPHVTSLTCVRWRRIRHGLDATYCMYRNNV